MGVFDWLFRRVATQTEPAPPPYIPFDGRAAPAPTSTEPDDIEEPASLDDEKIALEPIFATMEYTDSAGTTTRRGVTLLTLKSGPQAPMLTAMCHARNAVRTFRTDRIECFIEPDGEVIEPEMWFRDTLAIDIAAIATSQPRTKTPRRAAGPGLNEARAARERLRSPLSVLIIAARSDGDYSPEELNAVCQYVEEELLAASRELGDPMPSKDALDRLYDLLGRMRPHDYTLYDHMEATVRLDEPAFQRFRRALLRLIAADGTITDDEHEIVEDLDELRAERMDVD